MESRELEMRRGNVKHNHMRSDRYYATYQDVIKGLLEIFI